MAEPMRVALIGDAESPHLLKWALELARQPGVELWVASSRGFAAGFEAAVPASRTLALGLSPRHGGGNLATLRALPRLGAWLRRVDADWLHAHYLSSHGTLAWLARGIWGLRAGLVASAWGSDVLVTPERSATMRWLLRRVLRASALATSDSQHMAGRMQALGADEVLVFPFGLDRLPDQPSGKDPALCFANRALEPLYRPERVIEAFVQLRAVEPDARLVVAHDGSLRGQVADMARHLGLEVGRLADGAQVEFVGRLDAATQSRWYARARWYLSLPSSDSVSVSVLEAMAHGAIPLLSDLPANRELVQDGVNGLIVAEGPLALSAPDLRRLAHGAAKVAAHNRAWVAEHGLFAPAVQRFVARLRDLGAA